MPFAALSRAAVLFCGAAVAWPATAQSAAAPNVRAEVASARLGTGYAQMINLSASPDVSAATYRIDDADPTADLDVLRLPYQAKWLALSPDADLYWGVGAGWMRFKQDYPVLVGEATGTIGSRWTAYSLGAGVSAQYRLGQAFTLEPGIDVGLARLSNDASYTGVAEGLQPLLDGLLFNWKAYAWLVTPSVALAWTVPAGNGQAKVRGHVARSWIGSFDETDSVQHFNEAANIYSVRGEYLHPTPWRLFHRPVGAVAFAGYSGFFGASRDALGFDAVAEFGAGLEVPIAADRPAGERGRLSGSYLVGPGVWGWNVGVSIDF